MTWPATSPRPYLGLGLRLDTHDAATPLPVGLGEAVVVGALDGLNELAELHLVLAGGSVITMARIRLDHANLECECSYRRVDSGRRGRGGREEEGEKEEGRR